MHFYEKERKHDAVARGTSGNLPAPVRRQRMLGFIRDHDYVGVAELSERFGISEVTVRTDLDALAEEGRAKRVRGGAVAGALQDESSLEEAAEAFAAEKEAIGRAAAALVSSGETIVLDVGSTTTAVARALVERTDLERVVVVTNGLNIAVTFERSVPPFSVVVTGGTLRPLQHSLIDPLGGFVLERLNARTTFLGCNGVHPAAGITNINLPEAAMKQRLAAIAERTVVVADGSKIGTVSAARVCGIDDVDLLVTGTSAPDHELTRLQEAGLQIHIAEELDQVTTGSGRGGLIAAGKPERSKA